MGRLLGIVIVVLGLLPAGRAAADDPVVVELFTSQGCSACPPADSLLADLATRDDVIALALHVDYWDYIGWADTFGNPAFTARQHAYGRHVGSRVVYTPQMVVGGVDHIVGFQPMDVADGIVARRAAGYPVEVSLVRRGGAVLLQAETGAARPDMVVQLVRYTPLERVEIGRGENAGRVVDYANIVTSWREIGTWDGTAPFEARIEDAGPAPLVVIVQMRGPGEILGAARLD